MNVVDGILKLAKEYKASDVHINTDNPPVIRVDGVLRRLDVDNMTPTDLEVCVRELVGDKGFAELEQGKDVDCSYTDNEGDRFRVNAYRQMGELAAAIRILSGEIPTLEQYNMPAIISQLADLPRGLVLVTGPTGSGKSTTLAGMIDHINTNKALHILTLEDPVEYIHNQKRAMVTQREINKDSKSFNDALRSALREDPDIILVGEMRDPETIALALTAAETGHLVLSTLHTVGAPDTINRIIDSFPGDQQDQVRAQLSTSLKGVISQVLLPKADGGRIASHEILVMDTAIAGMIRAGKIQNIPSAIMAGGQLGMQSLDVNLAELVRHGVIERNVAFEVSKDPDTLTRQLRR